MRLSLLMSSVAIAALATPAFALPDRYEQGGTCVGATAACVQEELQIEEGNRVHEKEGGLASDDAVGAVDASTGGPGAGGTLAARTADDDDDLGDEIGSTADEAGDEIGAFADEAGDEIGDAADEVGDEIGAAFD